MNPFSHVSRKIIFPPIKVKIQPKTAREEEAAGAVSLVTSALAPSFQMRNVTSVRTLTANVYIQVSESLQTQHAAVIITITIIITIRESRSPRGSGFSPDSSERRRFLRFEEVTNDSPEHWSRAAFPVPSFTAETFSMALARLQNFLCFLLRFICIYL